MLKTVIGLFDSRDQAEKAASELRGSGFKDEVSILAADKDNAGNKAREDDGMNLTSGVTTGGADWPAWDWAPAHWLSPVSDLLSPPVPLPALYPAPLRAAWRGAW
ncbi:MAG: hypothetical protein BWY65_00756 [Firmicutes bacterium ADurb.Bin373]|nr:MAG: hypothetical protein BWY65_00756 [Firmicutes bacterium ADurb.Bin373]